MAPVAARVCCTNGKWIDEIYRELCDPKAAARWYPLSDAGEGRNTLVYATEKGEELIRNTIEKVIRD